MIRGYRFCMLLRIILNQGKETTISRGKSQLHKIIGMKKKTQHNKAGIKTIELHKGDLVRIARQVQ